MILTLQRPAMNIIVEAGGQVQVLVSSRLHVADEVAGDLLDGGHVLPHGLGLQDGPLHLGAERAPLLAVAGRKKWVVN